MIFLQAWYAASLYNRITEISDEKSEKVFMKRKYILWCSVTKFHAKHIKYSKHN